MAYQKLISIIRALDMELDTNNTEKAYPIGWSDWALFAIFENTALSCRSCIYFFESNTKKSANFKVTVNVFRGLAPS